MLSATRQGNLLPGDAYKAKLAQLNAGRTLPA